MADPFEPRIPGHVPKLAGQRWDVVAPYLEEFLKSLLGASDGTQTAVVALSGAAGAGEADDPPFRPHPPAAHTHPASQVQDLEPGFVRRPAAPHTHPDTDVHGLLGSTQLILQAQIFGRR